MTNFITVHQEVAVVDEEILPRRGTRESREPLRFIAGSVIMLRHDGKAYSSRIYDGKAYSSHKGPTDIWRAWNDPRWKPVLQAELDQFTKNKSWVLVKNEGQHTLNTIWLLYEKWDDAINEHIKDKGRLVINGKGQHESEYDKVFAATPCRDTVKMFQAICTHRRMHMSSGDVTGAYRNAPIDKPVFVKPPIGMELAPEDRGKILKLEKGVYGILQGANLWEKFRNESLELYGFEE